MNASGEWPSDHYIHQKEKTLLVFHSFLRHVKTKLHRVISTTPLYVISQSHCRFTCALFRSMHLSFWYIIITTDDFLWIIIKVFFVNKLIVKINNIRSFWFSTYWVKSAALLCIFIFTIILSTQFVSLYFVF